MCMCTSAHRPATEANHVRTSVHTSAICYWDLGFLPVLSWQMSCNVIRFWKHVSCFCLFLSMLGWSQSSAVAWIHLLSRLLINTLFNISIHISFGSQIELTCRDKLLHKDSNLKGVWMQHWIRKVKCVVWDFSMVVYLFVYWFIVYLCVCPHHARC